MAALAVRFSGRQLSHLGRAVAPVVEALLDSAPDEARWGGYVPKRHDRRRVAKPRPVARRGPLVDALADSAWLVSGQCASSPSQCDVFAVVVRAPAARLPCQPHEIAHKRSSARFVLSTTE